MMFRKAFPLSLAWDPCTLGCSRTVWLLVSWLIGSSEAGWLSDSVATESHTVTGKMSNCLSMIGFSRETGKGVCPKNLVLKIYELSSN